MVPPESPLLSSAAWGLETPPPPPVIPANELRLGAPLTVTGGMLKISGVLEDVNSIPLATKPAMMIWYNFS